MPSCCCWWNNEVKTSAAAAAAAAWSQHAEQVDKILAPRRAPSRQVFKKRGRGRLAFFFLLTQDPFDWLTRLTHSSLSLLTIRDTIIQSKKSAPHKLLQYIWFFSFETLGRRLLQKCIFYIVPKLGNKIHNTLYEVYHNHEIMRNEFWSLFVGQLQWQLLINFLTKNFWCLLYFNKGFWFLVFVASSHALQNFGIVVILLRVLF
jgi:hypothetical protein